MKSISREELKGLRDRKEDVLLISVTPEEDFRRKRIPGSINVPAERPDFVEEVERRAQHKTRRIVVYCSGNGSTASLRAAEGLDRAGFTEVRRFEGGVREWLLEGLRIESGALNEL